MSASSIPKAMLPPFIHTLVRTMASTSLLTSNSQNRLRISHRRDSFTDWKTATCALRVGDSQRRGLSHCFHFAARQPDTSNRQPPARLRLATPLSGGLDEVRSH